MTLYDYRLDALVAVAETGSLNKAAERLHLAVPSLAKQIDTLESEHGLVLFERTRRGCALTSAGSSLLEDARALMRLSDDAVARASRAAGADTSRVRLGISYLSPAQKTLDAWPAIHAKAPELTLELVPIEDLYDTAEPIVDRLGEKIDLIQAAWSTARWKGRCQALMIGAAHLSIDLPRQSPLASKAVLEPNDLTGTNVYLLRDAFDGLDDVQRALNDAGARPSLVESYDLGIFNEVAEAGGAILTCGAWSGLHPALQSVPLKLGLSAPCALLYPLRPNPATAGFVTAFEHLLQGPSQSA